METVKSVKNRQAFGREVDRLSVKIQIGVRGHKISASWIAVDLFDKSPIIDFNWDVHCLPIENETVECYMCNAVLEHVIDPALAVSEMHRTLRMGGHIWVEVPFLQFYHPHPGDFWRWTVPGIRLFMEDFQEVGSGVNVGISHEVPKVFDHTCRALRRSITVPPEIVEWFQAYDKRVSNPHMYSSVHFWGKKTQSAPEEKTRYMQYRQARYVKSQELQYAPNEKVSRQRLAQLVENYVANPGS